MATIERVERPTILLDRSSDSIGNAKALLDYLTQCNSYLQRSQQGRLLPIKEETALKGAIVSGIESFSHLRPNLELTGSDTTILTNTILQSLLINAHSATTNKLPRASVEELRRFVHDLNNQLNFEAGQRARRTLRSQAPLRNPQQQKDSEEATVSIQERHLAF